MHLDASGKYSAFEELMSYYHLNFYVYIILMLIVLVNCIKTIIDYIRIKKGNKLKSKSDIFNIITSILAGGGLFSGAFFHGVIADISDKYNKIWTSSILSVCIISFILFIIQIVFMILGNKIEEKNKKLGTVNGNLSCK